MPKRLFVRAAKSHNGQKTVVPVNSGEFIHVESDIGKFSVSIDIKNFYGCKHHDENSLHHRSDPISMAHNEIELPNVRILTQFTPTKNIAGSDLLFGNDCEVSINGRVPISLISTGLRFFKWFVNPTINSELYGDLPYLYGLALNSFTKLGVESLIDINQFLSQEEERLSTEEDIPTELTKRQKYFCQIEKCQDFNFEKNEKYFLLFDTNLIRICDSQYHVAIPTYRDNVIDLDVLRYADDKLNNFNWTIKEGGTNGMYEGTFGLVVNFALVDED